VVGLAAMLVLPFGLSDGGYFGHSLTALTLAVGAIAGLGVLRTSVVRATWALTATTLSLGLLTLWVALSAVWATEGSDVELETRRCVVYLAALVSVVLVAREHERAFLLASTVAVSTVAGVGLCLRAVSGLPHDRFYGTLLAEPVGYPNAMGELAAAGTVLAVGLAHDAGRRESQMLRALAPVLVLVLGLSGSRGAVLALGAGVALLVALEEPSARLAQLGTMALAVAVGGCAWGLTAGLGGAGPGLAAAVVLAASIGAALPSPGRRAALVLVCVLAIAIGVVVALRPPTTTTSYRAAYWGAALAEARERPLLGSGAGSFYLSWREHRTVSTNVRDAHSLYLESLSELGPVGLVLVMAIVAVPLGAAVRRRGDPIAAAAAAGFGVYALHAGLDWDWEMPVVTLVGLGCAGALLTRGPRRASEAGVTTRGGGRDGQNRETRTMA